MNRRTLLLGGAIMLLLIAVWIFASTMFAYFVAPFFLAKEQEVARFALDSSVDEVAGELRKRRDLTPNSSSATLTMVAEIINSSGVEEAASTLAEKLETLGIKTVSLSNGISSEVTLVSLKEKALLYREDIIERIGTRSGELRVEDLPETETVDIRIIIGR